MPASRPHPASSRTRTCSSSATATSVPHSSARLPQPASAASASAAFATNPELPRFFDLSTVFVLPSRHEPWGLIVNEVMNASTPVIVTDDVGCAPDLIENGVNGYIYPAGDVAALEQAGCTASSTHPASLKTWPDAPLSATKAGASQKTYKDSDGRSRRLFPVSRRSAPTFLMRILHCHSDAGSRHRRPHRGRPRAAR